MRSDTCRSPQATAICSFSWPTVATALLDRLLHHAVIVQIKGSSYRLRQHVDIVPDVLRSPPLAVTQMPRHRGRPPEPDLPSLLPVGRDRQLGQFTSALLQRIKPALTADAPNEVWAMDFMSDQLFDGRPIPILAVVDIRTRDGLAITPRANFRAAQIVEVLDGSV